MYQDNRAIEDMQLEAANAKAAQLEFENAELKEKAQNAEQGRKDEAARVNMLVQAMVQRPEGLPIRKKRVANSPPNTA